MDQNEALLRKLFRDTLREQHSQGIAEGAYAISAIVLEKANAEGKTESEKLSEIVSLCVKCLNSKKKHDTEKQGNGESDGVQ